MTKSNLPFYQWVPRSVGILILLFMFIPPTLSGGAYMSNLSEMTGGLGVLSEDILLASLFTGIGMCLFPPFMVKFLQARNIKRTYIDCFLLLILLNYICAIATSTLLLLVACLLIGFVRAIVMLNCTFTIAPYLTGMDTLSMFTLKEEPPADVQYTLERKRTFLMPVLYCFILMISQAGNMLTAWFAYEYHWQDAYYVVIGILLVAILLVVATMPNVKSKIAYKIEWRKVPEMLLTAIALCSMAYILIYGKVEDWLDSDKINKALALMLISVGVLLLLLMRKRNDEPYLPLRAFSYRNVSMAMLLFLLTMVFNSASSFIGTFAKLSTSINNLQNASLGSWAILGYIGGFIVSIVLIVKKVHFRVIFCLAFLMMAAANAYLYFQYQTNGLFSNMAIPTLLNNIGLLMLYSLVAAWGMKHLPSRHLATFVFLMILMRNAIAPVVGSSIYSNWLNHKQQYYIDRLVENVDHRNAIATATFTQTQRAGIATGKEQIEATRLATTTLKAQIGKQATIVAMKDISGQTVIFLLATATLTLLLPYHRFEST